MAEKKYWQRPVNEPESHSASDEPKQYATWADRGYKDTRNRNKRRFFMLEQTDASRMLVAKSRTRLAKMRNVSDTKEALSDAEVIREALRHFSGGN
jgi:hypothetical protein